MMSVGSRGKQSGCRWTAGLLGIAALALGAVALAQTAQTDDPGPQGGVARLSYVDGKVQILQGSQVLADQAPVNAPLVAGVTLTTAQDGQAEVQFEDGSIARISPNSALTLTSLPGQGGQGEVVLNSGLGYFELQNGSVGVRFADAAATVAGSTIFRVDVDTPPGVLAVFSGNVHLVRGDALALDLHGGESLSLGAGDPSQYNISESIAPDSWDAWNSDRDQALSAESADQTAATNDNPEGDTPAWNDLAANGNWYDVPGQGYVWSPYEASDAGWDPYGCGNWVWTPGYGYTWASCESWGFLPYQVGSWSYYDGFGWGWTPGVVGVGAHFWFGGHPGVHILRGPDGYRPIVRPGPPGRGGHYPHPPVAINRHTNFAGAEPLPSRDRDTPVRIAGATVMPMRTQGGRQSGGRGAFGGAAGFGGTTNHSTPAYTQGYTQNRQVGGSVRAPEPSNQFQRPGYTPPASANRNSASPGYTAPSRSIYTQPGRSVYTPPSQPARTFTPPSRPANNYTPPARNYNPPSGHPGGFSAPPPSRPPSGGGGGGGNHGGGHH